jgi:hypothetical protein
MLASPLFSKYYDNPKPGGDITSVQSERKWCLFGVNVGLTYILSLFTYSLSFASVLSYDINTMIYSNNSINSILTPEPWVQYLQWVNYAFLLMPISMYIGIYGHKYTKLKLYKLSPYLIVLNLIQTIINLLPYKESLFLGMSLFGNISMICILISQFIKAKVTNKKDGWMKRFTIDIPISIYYQSCIINTIFLTNQIVYEVEPTYVYDISIFIGFVLILFILNFSVFIVTRNIFKGLLFSILMFLYGIYTYEYENNPNVTQNTVYIMRIIISITFIANSLIVFIYTICYCKRRKEIEEPHPPQLDRII